MMQNSMEVWYILCQRGTELSSDAEVVLCEQSDRISHLKQKVRAQNQSRLADLDASELEVFEGAESETKCRGQKELSKCTYGTVEQPFTIFYSQHQGTSLSP